MTEALSQQEIDKLLSGINSGEIKEDHLVNFENKKSVSEYDFRRPNRVSKDQLKTIKTIHENFSEMFGFYLASKLQTMASIDLLSVDQLRYSEYVLSINNPSCLFIYNIEETEGKSVLEMTPDLVMSIVERLMGGYGAKTDPNRGITAIEQRMIRPLILKALTTLTNIWKPVQTLNFKLLNFESNPDFVQIAPASEIVIVLSFEVKIGEDAFMLNLCYPSFALEEVIAKLNVQFFSGVQPRKDKMKIKNQITQQLKRTQLDVRAVLGKADISIEELLRLEVGDVLVLNSSLEDELPIYVSDRLKYYGRLGMINDRVAAKITRTIEDE